MISKKIYSSSNSSASSSSSSFFFLAFYHHANKIPLFSPGITLRGMPPLRLPKHALEPDAQSRQIHKYFADSATGFGF